MVLCKKCAKKAPASSMKLDYDEGKMICPECIKNKKIHKEIQEEVIHKKDSLIYKKDDLKKPIFSSPNNSDASPKEETSGKFGHKCSSCGYKFMVNPETRSPKSCPYCNSRITSF